jgi:predicted nucleotidyltransferase
VDIGRDLNSFRGVTENLIERIGRLFVAGSPTPVIAAYLFGSQAEERSHRESDIDIGVVFGRGMASPVTGRFAAGARLNAWLQAELRTARIDLVVLDDAPPTFAARVATTGRLLFCADAEGEHAFRRDVQLRAADLAPFLRRTRAIKLDALRP